MYFCICEYILLYLYNDFSYPLSAPKLWMSGILTLYGKAMAGLCEIDPYFIFNIKFYIVFVFVVCP